MTHPFQLIWHDSNWQKQAHEWIRAEAGHNSIEVVGEIEQNHAYAWSTVMRISTDEGPIFFKATAPETIYEIALTQKLAKWIPDCTPELIAVDTVRGWMLMRDGGEQLRASIRPAQDVRPWEPVITRYAELQIGLTHHVNEILALGIPDHRPIMLPALYEKLLEDGPSLMIAQDKGLTTAEFQHLQNLLPRFQQICADLAAFKIPMSLNHGDFHDGNVLLKNKRITFFDWGDANVTHPFASLRTFIVSMEIALKLEDYALPTPAMIALTNRYLESWKAFTPPDTLLKIYGLSRPVASISKALSWHQTISRLDSPLRYEYAWIVPEVLREYLVHMGIA